MRRSAYKKKGYKDWKKKRGDARADQREIIIASNRGYQRTSGLYGRFGIPRDGGDVELKYRDMPIQTGPIPDAGLTADSLNHIVQGTEANQRIGRKVVVKYIGLKGRIQFTSDLVTPGSGCVRIRIIVYLDKQANGAKALVGDILADNPLGGGSETFRVDSFRSLENINRFTVLSDKTHYLQIPSIQFNTVGGVGSADPTEERIVKPMKNVKINLGGKSIPIEFSGMNGTIGDVRSNNIGIVFISDTVGTNRAQFVGTTRIRYSDS